jgi:hypothetical protein
MLSAMISRDWSENLIPSLCEMVWKKLKSNRHTLVALCNSIRDTNGVVLPSKKALFQHCPLDFLAEIVDCLL